jgi:hypothetical protein
MHCGSETHLAMPNDHKINHIRAHALNLLNSGIIGNDAASDRLKAPIAVQRPDGQLHSWFVPVTTSGRLIGFFQFLADGRFMRYSSFQHRAGELANCPAAADWLDPHQIQLRAEVQRKTNETSSKPFLTYDQTPDRLVWAVPLINPDGEVRLVYVVGETVYVPDAKANNE